MPAENHCPICYGLEEAGAKYNEHLRTNHGEFYSWRKRWVRSFLLVMTPAVVVLLALMLLVIPRNDQLSQLLIVVAYMIFPAAMILNHARRVQGFRRAWKEEHGGPLGPNG